MPSPATPCCVVVLNQQQEESLHQHLKHCGSEPDRLTLPKRCTVVENGRVVVKLLSNCDA